MNKHYFDPEPTLKHVPWQTRKRRRELLDRGYQVIASGVSLDAFRKDAKSKTYVEGTLWIVSAEVLHPPANWRVEGNKVEEILAKHRQEKSNG